MTLSFVRSAETPASADVTSFAAQFAATPAAGNLLVAIFSCRGATSLAVTRTALTGAGWTELEFQDGGATGQVIGLWWKVSAGNESGSFAITTNVATRGQLMLFEYNDSNGGTWTADVDTGANGGGTAATSGASGTTGATAQAEELVVAAFGNRGLFGTTNTWTNSFVSREDAASSGNSSQASHLRVADKVTAATGTQSTTHTWTNSRQWAAVIAAFRSKPTILGAAALSGSGVLSGVGVIRPPLTGLLGWYDFSEPGALFEDTGMLDFAEADDAIAAVADKKGGGILLPIVNPSVESAIGFPVWYANWSGGGGDPTPSVTRVADGTAPFGANVGAVSQGGAVAGSIAQAVNGHRDSGAYRLRPGALYRISAYVKASRANQVIGWVGSVFDSGGTDLFIFPPDIGTSGVTYQPGDGWVRISALWGPMPANAHRGSVGLAGITQAGIAEMFRFDALQVEEAADAPRAFYTGTLQALTQGTAGSRPLRKVGIQAGKDVGRFDGTDDYLQNSVIADAQPFTVVGVAIANDATDETLLGGVTNDVSFGVSTGGVILMYAGGVRTSTVGGFNGAFRVFVGYFDGANSRGYVNGAAQMAGVGAAPGANNLNGIRIGANQPLQSDKYWNGDIAEVLIYDRALTGVELNKVGKYLAEKWGTAVQQDVLPVVAGLQAWYDFADVNYIFEDSGGVDVVEADDPIQRVRDKSGGA